jgi:hypothetical protein
MARRRAFRAFETFPPLKMLDGRAELTVAEDVVDPAPEVSASEMALHDIVRQGR